METALEQRTFDERIWWRKSLPFLLMHLAPLGLLWTGIRHSDVVLVVALYFGRMFFITAGFHRYFAHRAYKTSRAIQFVFAFFASSACQKGVLWWAAHHRAHHRHSDTELDIHSPIRGFWWSHVGWILCKKYQATDWERFKDFAKYRELVWLNRYHLVPGALLGATCFALGGWHALFAFFLSTVLLYHGTFSINSLMHLWGGRRYSTSDTSRNSLILALLSMGEGWHNNHHYYQSTANQGFFWWEVDMSYYLLKVLSWVGLVWDLRTPPPRILAANHVSSGSKNTTHADIPHEMRG
jgi:stearoyl-CoA desaturase (delta-9 desaturase)